jgi:hypothetical protein
MDTIEHVIDSPPVKHGLCIHNRRKIMCKDCGGSQICEHNKQKYSCKECKGPAICIHNKSKYTCKECKGSHICQHDIVKYSCRICNKDNICKHDIFINNCKECTPSITCIHGKYKYGCLQCGKACPHGKQKSYCKECGGSQYCTHGKRKSICKECKGTQICLHNKIKYDCIVCTPSLKCEHGVRKILCKKCTPNKCEHGNTKAYCKDCKCKKGSQVCIHNSIKKRCVQCHGPQICEHDKWKYYCRQCDGRYLCKSEWCDTIVTKKYNGYCLHCTVNLFPEIQISQNYKTKEFTVISYIREQYADYGWIHNRKIAGGISLCKPDLLLDLDKHTIIIEVDENQHNRYDCSCENKRLMQLSQDNKHKPIVFIRFNPDCYIDDSGIKIISCWRMGKDGVLRLTESKKDIWNQRLLTLKESINYWLSNYTEKMVEVIQLYFDGFKS